MKLSLRVLVFAAGVGAAAAHPVPDACFDADGDAHTLVAQLDPLRFRQNVATLAAFGTRYWSEQGNQSAIAWLRAELASYGYVVEQHAYPYQGQERVSLYVTKIGTLHPDQMWIVSSHLDSINTTGSAAPGADDDASGISLVLECARVLAPPQVTTESSLRFALWNNEETGLDGSFAYVADRRALQGLESPAGSGRYPEPRWLGIIEHDMILYDHGLPPQPTQIPGADIDVEYQASAALGGLALELAGALQRGNAAHTTRYPVEIGPDMQFTDSSSFQEDCPAVSVRENRRMSEIGAGANPHWHKATDVVANYSDEDFQLGFDTLRTTLGTLVELAGIAIDCRDTTLRFADPASRDTLSWSTGGAALCARSYDVARGELSSLLASGTFSSATCIANDRSASELVDATRPTLGNGFWYLVRVDGASWNSSLAVCP